ncbi:hypothetical protein DL240_07095 [Lujinxingia litoralis]|uniref:DUF560 domain-containing protein n=1 Tax=Lujinxingia litoralis TaxID=2211119 RepID=A0A328C993_9DELT|nr:hypothetical protein DL240_07095 [Lujinxingia litoralis]
MQPAQAQEVRWEGKVRASGELDDNPYRREGDGGEADGLMRYYGELELEAPVGVRGRVLGRMQHGGKVFFGERDADAFVSAGLLMASRWWDSGVALRVMGDVKDRSERVSLRDYTRGGTQVQLSYTGGPFQGRVGGGFRFFGFKPQPEVSSQGAVVQVGGALRARDDLLLDASWMRSWRGFEVAPLVLDATRTLDWGDGERRRDVFDVVRLGLTHRWWWIAELGYAYQRNRSNSYGQALNRHQAELELTVPGPWELFVSLRAEVQRTRYEDPVLIDETFVLDDENRNALGVALARRVGRRWEVEVRYHLYAQEFGVGESYRRQVAGVSLAYDFGSEE